jgi:tetratricopeptide (TPR) repeat protein
VAVLRVVDRRVDDWRRVTVSWVGGTTLTHEMDVNLPVDGVESEKVRWYLEDYAEFPAEPAPAVARDAEAVLATVGRQLFARVFAGRGAMKVWANAEADLARVRVEIDTDPSDVPGVPWELLRDPDADQAVALGAAAFVRTHHQTARSVRLPEPTTEQLRVLLVICRPGGREDVPFRSVASRLVRSGVERLAGLELQVLRPPTFAKLARVLRAAAEAGRPYHIVHFDGHGAYLDASLLAEDAVAVSALRYGSTGQAREGRHGYLLFEDPTAASNQRLVDGPMLAELLVETRVPVLVLNACRSAYAEAPHAPDSTKGVHDRIRAYGSLAAEVADVGVPGVVAMRYNVYVDTAARFVEDLYQQLAAGRSLGVAVSAARKALKADPVRRIGPTPVALQDWVVPTVYEPVPLTLRTSRAEKPPVPERAFGVPDAPDVGFFGRDEALLALDRALDTDRIVLLHALAGAGKTTTVAEFARWYVATGGPADAVLWSSFEHHTPLDSVLDAAGVVFASRLEARGVLWLAITDRAERRALILDELARVPVLWVWDNVEPITGFPAGTPSASTPGEQAELYDFLRDLQKQTRARVLLTSRRDEYAWLGELPRRVALAPMPMRERLQLAHALVRRLAGVPRGDEIDWHGLLRFAGGNPLTIAVLVRQAVRREKVTTTRQVDAFVARVRSGATPLEPAQNANLGRSASLAASLAYGFTHAFTEPEHAQLALLHLFRDIVNVDVLRLMGDSDLPKRDVVAELAGVDRDSLTALLGRTAELGLLTDYGDGYYGIHPALPWFFTDLFVHHIPDPAAAERAYAHIYAAVGRFYFEQVGEGRAAEVLPALRAEEANLRHGLLLARTRHLPTPALNCAQGLRALYELTGRATEWARLVAGIQGDYIDPDTDQPRPGRDNDYSVITEYRVDIARTRRDWPTATRLHTILTAWDRDRAAPYLDLAPEQLDPTARHRLHSLGASEMLLGELLREQDDPACRGHFQAAYDLAGRVGHIPGQAAAASGLGNAYLVVPGLYDLGRAEHWHQQRLDLTPEQDRIGRAASHNSLAAVAYKRLFEARAAGATTEQLVAYLEQARAGHQQALDLLPADHHEHRAVAHNQLGLIYQQVGEVTRALGHYQQAIRHKEARGDIHGAGTTRFNVARLLGRYGGVGDALLYARAALANFEQVGPGAAAMAGEAEALIQDLERILAAGRS